MFSYYCINFAPLLRDWNMDYSKLFNSYVCRFYYNGKRLQFTAYRKLVDDPSMENFKLFKRWYGNPSNSKEIEEIEETNQDRIIELREEWYKDLADWRESITKKLPTLESLSYRGMYNIK